MKMNNKDYPVEGEKVVILDDNAFNEKLTSWPNYPLWKVKLIGGFCFETTKKIYIRQSRKDDVKLLNHERGHLRGYKHTWHPTLMASSWIYRWFNTYFPPHR